VVDGTKVFITNAGTDITGFVTVAAVTRPAMATTGPVLTQARPEISAIVVPAGTPGLSVSKKYSKVGWSASDTRELSFSGCRVPVENLLGVEGRGYAQFLQILDEGRVAVAALSVGLAQGCIDECLSYMAEREAFGRRLSEYEALQFKLADMEARAHAARLAWYDAARRLVDGKPFKKEAAMAKLLASDAAMVNAREATQIFGGYGFMNETPVGRFYRDAKILEIGEGTSEVLRLVIARELGLPAGPGTRA
jgi:butyryl-CoA dehydrogenase